MSGEADMLSALRERARKDKDYILDLDYLPPSDNRLKIPIRGGRGGFALTPEAREFYDHIRRAWSGLGYPRNLPGWWSLDLMVTLGARWRDGNNMIKVVCDALEKAGAIEDDKRILAALVSVSKAPRGSTAYPERLRLLLCPADPSMVPTEEPPAPDRRRGRRS